MYLYLYILASSLAPTKFPLVLVPICNLDQCSCACGLIYFDIYIIYKPLIDSHFTRYNMFRNWKSHAY